MAQKFRTNIDLVQNQLINTVLQKIANASLGATIASPVGGQIYYDTTNLKAYFYNGSAWIDMSGGVNFTIFSDGTNTATADTTGDTFKIIALSNKIAITVANDDATYGDCVKFDINTGNIDHNSLLNLTTGDPHTQYMHISTARTVSAAHTFTGTPLFNPTSGAPFSTNSTTKVTNLNADLLDGFNTSTTNTAASVVVVATSGGKIDSTFLTEVIQATDLSDVAAKSGTGTTILFGGSPTITNPTLVPVSTVSIDAGAGRLTNLADPTSAQDAATKNYVDIAVQGLDIHGSVRGATVGASITLAGGAPSTLDGLTLATNDRILVKDQSTGSQNGIYIVQTVGTGVNGTWVRAADADTSVEVTSGLFVFVSAGTVNAATGWVLTTPDPITLGTTSLSFSQFSGSGAYTATNVGTSGVGTWDSTTGNQFKFRKINAASTKVTVTLNGQQIDLDVAEANLTLNNIGGTLALNKGGTGQTTASAARVALGTPGMFAAYANSGVTTQTFTHSLNTLDVLVQCYEAATGAEVQVDVVRASVNTVTLTWTTATASGTELRVVIFGQG